MRSYGEIVLVSALLDPRGRNPKDRPAIIVTPDAELGPGRPFRVVAITTLIPDPMPDDHVLIPWQLPRHPRTGLNRRAAAVGSWVAPVDEGRVLRSVGVVPGKQLRALAGVLERIASEGETAEEDLAGDPEGGGP